VRFWDASAVVPLLLGAPPGDRLVGLLEEDSQVLAWWGSPLECASAIARREREAALSPPEAVQAEERLRLFFEASQEILPSTAVRNLARRLLRVHPLRAADALQLAAAVLGAEHAPATLDFVSLDARLSDAARREGFRVIGE